MADGDLEELTRQLRVALARIQRLSDDHWHALDPTCGAMDADAWMGPAGRRFGSSVRSDRVELRGQLSQAVRNAQAKLAAVPKIS
ncbi:hypothetical protein [Actinoallomurus iriomotensis]|uniref:Uncharacterized protein n=1 Tax=Actinoallomurus iriomotensis TaxID=478107 RepID=A0A9W6S362_9ACTN|nr:hypothetical protein [Actinoallomurus iriomotensis]GLY84782.1 hypothetical protein Airi02_027110 [Actinoallomurus iriomotensis]